MCLWHVFRNWSSRVKFIHSMWKVWTRTAPKQMNWVLTASVQTWKQMLNRMSGEKRLLILWLKGVFWRNSGHDSLQSGNSHPDSHDLYKLGSDEISGSQWERLSDDQRASGIFKWGKLVTTLKDSQKAYGTVTEADQFLFFYLLLCILHTVVFDSLNSSLLESE